AGRQPEFWRVWIKHDSGNGRISALKKGGRVKRRAAAGPPEPSLLLFGSRSSTAGGRRLISSRLRGRSGACRSRGGWRKPEDKNRLHPQRLSRQFKAGFFRRRFRIASQH